ncbi:MAG: biopolymer transporter ExbD [Phycisphaerae bacterium]|nr:biopolymer transporter ExbD [Phycisphaerae bacterium]
MARLLLLILLACYLAPEYQHQEQAMEDLAPISSEPTPSAPTKHIVINIINPDNPQIVLEGQVLTLQELTEKLKHLGGAPGESLEVILNADPDIPYEDIARVMLAVGAAGIEGWEVTTETEEPAR